jgi:hypothetical protein
MCWIFIAKLFHLMGSHSDAQPEIMCSHPFCQHGQLGIVKAGTAIFLRHNGTKCAQFGKFGQNLAGNGSLLVISIGGKIIKK